MAPPSSVKAINPQIKAERLPSPGKGPRPVDQIAVQILIPLGKGQGGEEEKAQKDSALFHINTATPQF